MLDAKGVALEELREVVQILDYIVEVHDFCEYPARCVCCGGSHHKTCTELQKDGDAVGLETGSLPFPCEGCVALQDTQAWLERNRPRAK